MKPFQKILVPTDFSKGALLALERALDLRAQHDGQLVLLHVYELPIVYGEAYAFGADMIRDIEAAARAQMKELEAFVEKRVGNGQLFDPPLVSSKVVPGAAAFTIVDEARNGAYDLIVMGTHGRTGLGRVLIGSVAERVVRTAPCAVLTIRGEL